MSELSRMVCTFCLLLAACGGEGGNGGSANGGGVAVVTVPTPPPTTAPPASYPLAMDLSRDREMFGQGVELTAMFRYVPGKPRDIPPESVSSSIITGRYRTVFTFRAADTAAWLNYDGEVSNYTASDLIVPRFKNDLAWSRESNDERAADFFVIAQPNLDESYVAASRQLIYQAEGFDVPLTQNIHRYFLFGSRTLSEDLSRAGGSTYRAFLATTSFSLSEKGFYGKADEVSVDHAAGTITSSIVVTEGNLVEGLAPMSTTLTLTGGYGSNGFIGRITSAGGRYGGSFAGDLFGPNGQELGLVIMITRTDGSRMIGLLTARRG